MAFRAANKLEPVNQKNKIKQIFESHNLRCSEHESYQDNHH